MIMTYILVYNVDEYPEMGGGIQFESFETPEALDKRVEKIYNSHDILAAGELTEYTYKEVETVTKIIRE